MEGFVERPFPGFGGLNDSEAPESLSLDHALKAQNVRFSSRGTSVFTRPGLTATYRTMNRDARVTAIGEHQRLDENHYCLMAFTSDGRLEKEDPEGSGASQLIESGFGTDRYPVLESAYSRAYIAFGNGITGVLEPKQYHKYGTQFYLDDVGMNPNTDDANGMATSASAGNIDTGVRYCAVMFRTRTGYITGFTLAATRSANLATGSRRVDLTGIPVSADPNVIERIIAFTFAGGSDAGPYYFIEADDTVDGVSITRTVIPDNTTTTATFNFTDSYLAGLSDISAYFNKVKLPFMSAVSYSKRMRRLFWCGDPDLPSAFRASEIDDPETYYETDSIIEPAEGVGQRAVTMREYKGETYLLMERSGHVTEDTTATPATWGTYQRWSKVGPAGPRAVDVNEDIMAFAHRSGVYVYLGNAPIHVSHKIHRRWRKINWEFGHLVWLRIDAETQRIYIGVPMGHSTIPDKVFVMDYDDADFSRNFSNVRWSEDTIAAHDAIRTERALPAANDANENITGYQPISQFVFASAAPDGAINMCDDPPGQPEDMRHDDNGAGIEAIYHTAFDGPRGAHDWRLGQVDVTVRGAGSLHVEARKIYGVEGLHLRAIELEALPLTYERKPKATATISTKSPRWGLRITNENEPGAWFDLSQASLWINRG